MNNEQTKLCKTNPIFKMPKMNLTPYFTITNNNELQTMNYSKQTQTNPILNRTSMGSNQESSLRFENFGRNFRVVIVKFADKMGQATAMDSNSSGSARKDKICRS
jgi:hypothetical protein